MGETLVGEPSVLCDGLVFAESPRWQGGRLWFSDMHGHAVCNVTLAGELTRVLDVPGQPSGLGFMPDGALLIVSMKDRRILRLKDGQVSVHADLMGCYARGELNDMIVSPQGRAYVGQYGSDTYAGEPQQPTSLILIEPDGTHRAVAGDLKMPNGMALSPDGAWLYVAETYRPSITRFRIAADGDLGEREIFADLAARPDGICLDAEGCIWFGSAQHPGGGTFRVAQGGRILQAVQPEGWRGVACALGGEGRDTLFLLESQRASPRKIAGAGNSRIRTLPAPAPGAGLP
ncbi:MAG: gluconolactonase [Phenylobacterium sp.]|nr:gluconolactonase [Phenylobacterium sp.]